MSFQLNCSVLTFNYFLLPLIRLFCGDKHLAAAVNFRFECETLKNKHKKTTKKQLDGIRFFVNLQNRTVTSSCNE